MTCQHWISILEQMVHFRWRGERNLASDDEHIPPLCGFEESVRRLFMDCAEDEGAGGAAPKHLIEKHLGCPFGILPVSKLLLRRKRVGLEPLEELLPICPDHVDLGEVDVRVDEAGGDEVLGAVLDLKALSTVPCQDL